MGFGFISHIVHNASNSVSHAAGTVIHGAHAATHVASGAVHAAGQVGSSAIQVAGKATDSTIHTADKFASSGENAVEHPGRSVQNIVNGLGRINSRVGTDLSKGASWAQNQVNRGVDHVDSAANGAVASFQRSSLGKTSVGRNLSNLAKGYVHFEGGVVKGVSSLPTGVVGAVGLQTRLEGAGQQYATSQSYRNGVNHSLEQFGQAVHQHPGAIPEGLLHSASTAWHQHPADFLGQISGQILTTVATAGTGDAGEAADAANGLKTLYNAASDVSLVPEAQPALQPQTRAGG